MIEENTIFTKRLFLQVEATYLGCY